MSEHSSSRDIALIESALPSEPEKFNRWAIIVGISKYQVASLNLRYADRDAEELYQLLLTPRGGHFQKDFVCKLTNKSATTANVIQALRAFLKKPAREDLVLIYFACHGAPDPERPENVYLLTHDTNPKDIAGTALPVGDINRALKDTLLSEKVIILADTCHSAAIGGGMRSRGIEESAALINRYLKEISTARGGTALLTSAEAHEVSFEDAKWGGGHGVFTHYLLKGLRGEADRDNNGFVTVGELFEYVRENVKKATNHKQHPSIGTNPFDRNLPLAVVTNSPSTEKSLLASNSLLLSLSESRKRYPFILIMGTCLVIALGGMYGFLLSNSSERSFANNSSKGNVIEGGKLDPAQGYDLSAEDKTIRDALVAADRLEKVAKDELQTEGLSGENLDFASDNWQEAIKVLDRAIPENTSAPKAERKIEEYKNRLLYTSALRQGLAASQLISRKVTIAEEIKPVDISSEDCQRVEKLWQGAIDTLKEIPATDPNYLDVDRKIATYTSNLGYASKKKIVADYLRAVQIAEQTAIWSQEAKTSDDWIKIADLWGQAADLMSKVPNEPEKHKAIANVRIPIYQNNDINALQKAGGL